MNWDAVIRWSERIRARWNDWRTAPRRCLELECEVLGLREQLVRDRRAAEALARAGLHIEKLEWKLARYGELAGVPGLSPGEIERLALLAEECGEVAQAAGKVLRFGWESASPYSGKPNRMALEREIGNLRAVVNLMIDSRDLRLNDLQAWQRLKRASLAKWTLYQDCSVSREEQLAMIDAIREAADGAGI